MTSYTCHHISPFVFIIGTFSFLCSFLLHVEIWRVSRPVKQMAYLAVIFVLGPLFVYLCLNLVGCFFQSPGSWFVRDIFNITYVYIWHLALSTVYIMSYPAIQAESPSLVILLGIDKNMPEGLTTQQIEEIFPPDTLIKDRIDDLVAERFMRSTKDGYALTFKGRLLGSIFACYRRLLALPLGEG